MGMPVTFITFLTILIFQLFKMILGKIGRAYTGGKNSCGYQVNAANKCPGPDSFPAEFFKTFSSSLSQMLCSVFVESCKWRWLPQFFTEACITLIPKKGKDPTDCTWYRPISLLNTDAKVLAKVLAHRLESILSSIISFRFLSNYNLGMNKLRHLFLSSHQIWLAVNIKKLPL